MAWSDEIKMYSDIGQRQPELSYVAPQNFYMVFDKLPQISFNCQDLQIPSASVGEAPLANRLNPNQTFIPGQSFVYSPLDVNFLIEKDFRNYRSVLKWMKAIAEPETAEQFKEWSTENARASSREFGSLMSNCSVFGTDSANEILAEWRFIDAFPINLDGPRFDATPQDVEYLVSGLTLRYKYFEFLTYTDGIANNDLV